MTDKEVGELWHLHAGDGCNIEKLIRKLVEERVANIFNREPHGEGETWKHLKHEPTRKQIYLEALRDFGINLATWPKE